MRLRRAVVVLIAVYVALTFIWLLTARTSLTTTLAVLVLVVGVPLNLYVTVRLWRLARLAPHNRVVRDRAIVAAGVLAVVTVFGLIFLNNDLIPPILGPEITRYITRSLVLAVAVGPALYWIRLYRDWS